MTRTIRVCATALAVCTATGACASDFSAPEPEDTYGGIKYTSEVLRTMLGFNLAVTLHNTGTEHQVRTYPVSCGVRFRIYRLADSHLVYDETRRACAPEPVGTVHVDGNSTAMLYSGNRSVQAIAGDSIQSGDYGVRAVVRTEGDKLVLIYAGVITL